MGAFVIFLTIIILSIFFFKSIKIIKPNEAGVVETLGRYKRTIQPGLNIINPVFDRVRIVIMNEMSIDIPPQLVITNDNISISIDSVVFYKVVDPQKSVYAINDLKRSIQYVAQTTVRDIVGGMKWKEVFPSREIINRLLLEALKSATEPWGCEVNHVEIINIILPKDIREQLENQIGSEGLNDTHNMTYTLNEDENDILRRAREASKEES